MGTGDSSFGHPLHVAGVVPAVGNAVFVRVNLQVIHRRRSRTFDQGFLLPDHSGWQADGRDHDK
jgi:hypothetical protein